jgi:hypothetical protein
VKQAFGPQARLIVRGSAATGKKYNPADGNYNNSKSFDEKSDYDFALVDKDLLEEIKGHKELGYLIREGIDGRTQPIYRNELRTLTKSKSGKIPLLKQLLDELELSINQEFSIMVYGNHEKISNRGPHFAVGKRSIDK